MHETASVKIQTKIHDSFFFLLNFPKKKNILIFSHILISINKYLENVRLKTGKTEKFVENTLFILNIHAFSMIVISN